MTSYSNKLVTCPTASAELRAFSIGAFGRGQSNFAALIYVVITGSNAQRYAEPLPSRWTVSGALPEHSKAFTGIAVMSWRLRANWWTPSPSPYSHSDIKTHFKCDGGKLPCSSLLHFCFALSMLMFSSFLITSTTRFVLKNMFTSSLRVATP